jgi:hypothetical protein
MTQKKEYKICFISEQLAAGGAERCAAIVSVFESKKIRYIMSLLLIKYNMICRRITE